jgi:hypothetical protein
MPHSSEIHTGRMAFFPPWFLEKKVLKKVRGMLPDYYHKRLRYYFDVFGCIRCGRKDVIYSCGGLCLGCQWTINNRLKKSDKEMKRHYGASERRLPSAQFLKRYTTAQELLRGFKGKI